MNRNQIFCSLVTGISFLIGTITLSAQEISELPWRTACDPGPWSPLLACFHCVRDCDRNSLFLGCFYWPAPLADREEDRQLKKLEFAVTLSGLVVRSDEVGKRFFIILTNRNDDSSYTPILRVS